MKFCLLIFLFTSFLSLGCEDDKKYDEIEFEWQVDLPQDENSFYHLQHSSSWQTLKRLTAHLHSEHANNREDKESPFNIPLLL